MTRALCAAAIVLTTCVASARAAPPAAAVGLVPAEAPAITQALADGARLAFEQAAKIDGLKIELRVGPGPTHWGTASASAVELAFGPSVVALITPPDRATAHLVAQIGSRAHIPVLTTTRSRSIGGTGSYWVIPLLELAADHEEPASLAEGTWVALGHRAATAICDAVRNHGLDRYGLVNDLRELSPLDPAGDRDSRSGS